MKSRLFFLILLPILLLPLLLFTSSCQTAAGAGQTSRSRPSTGVGGPEGHNARFKLKSLTDETKRLRDQARFQEALLKAREALALAEKIFGPDDEKIIGFLSLVSSIQLVVGDFASAEALLFRAMAIAEKSGGSNNFRVGDVHNNLAKLYRTKGDFPKAETHYRTALAIYEKTLGPGDGRTGGALHNLAHLKLILGDFGPAVELAEKARKIHDQADGEKSKAVAEDLNLLGKIYSALGDYEKAERLFKQALAIREDTWGPDHPKTADDLNQLGRLYLTAGRYDEAVASLEKALAIYRKSFGNRHPAVAEALKNLAWAYRAQGKYDRVMPLLLEALSINEEMLGPEHAKVAQDLNRLGKLARSMGRYDEAEKYFERALAIRKKSLGEDNPKTGSIYTELALLSAARGDYRKALDYTLKAEEIQGRFIDQVLGFTSEDEMVMFLATKRDELHMFLSLVSGHLSSDSRAVQEALNAWLRRKGLVFEAQRRMQEALVYSGDREGVKVFEELSRTRNRLAQLTFRTAAEEDEGTDRATAKKIAELEGKIDELESRLSKLSQAYAKNRKVGLADADQVAAKLPSGTALIEFARIRDFNFQAQPREKRWRNSRYLAFILPAGAPGRIRLVDLGEAKTIDLALAKFKRAVTNPNDPQGTGADEASRRLYDLIFAPLEKNLGSVRNIYLSPDGNLNLIPFEVLKRPDGKYLIDDYTFTYLSAGRDVLGFGQMAARSGKGLVIGDPVFDLSGRDKKAALSRLGLTRSSESTRSADLGGLMFSPLPGTREEAEAVVQVLGPDRVDLYTGREALEEVVKAAKDPGVLHLATHGFFLRDLEIASPDEETLDLRSDDGRTKNTAAKKFNPLLRSGLALAGANQAGSGAGSDGIFTAEEVLSLKLWGTELVVLSACETGLGEVKAGEGVYGLRRAFAQAGAKSLVMSMWSVPDRETMELMTGFYKYAVSGRMTRDQALRRAALDQKQEIQKRYGHTNPFYWGAFVFMGEP